MVRCPVGAGFRRAFTLVELLVTVSIIGVLIGILAPALGSARKAARSTACLSQVRQLQVASMMYSDANRGALIEPGLDHGGFDNEQAAWVNLLEPYYGSKVAVKSPNDRSPHWPRAEGGDGAGIPGYSNRYRRTSYGINNMITHKLNVAAQPGDTAATIASRYFNRMQKISAPTRTAQFLLMAEEGPFAGADHVHVESWWRRGRVRYDTAAAQMALDGFLDQGEKPGPSWRSNYGFLDGHAATLRFEEVYSDPTRNMFDPRLYQ